MGKTRIFDGYDWTALDQASAQVWGWELSQFGDGQICIVADDERTDFLGPRRNLAAHQHVARNAYTKRRDLYRRLCLRALDIADRSHALSGSDPRG